MPISARCRHLRQGDRLRLRVQRRRRTRSRRSRPPPRRASGAPRAGAGEGRQAASAAPAAPADHQVAPRGRSRHAGIAQLVEQRFCKPLVVGSIPTAGTDIEGTVPPRATLLRRDRGVQRRRVDRPRRSARRCGRPTPPRRSSSSATAARTPPATSSRRISQTRCAGQTSRRNSGGQSKPNNEGIRLARGTHIAYLGHDDVWSPHHLERLAGVVQAHDPDFAVSGAVYHGPPGSRFYQITGKFDDPGAASREFFPPSSFAHRRDVVDRIGPWREPGELRAPARTANSCCAR